MLGAPDIRKRVESFGQLFEERHYPLYASFFDYYVTGDDEPPCTVLRRGIPYELHGIGYEDLHQMWDAYRDGFSALALLPKPPDSSYMELDGVRVAWLESAAARIPQHTLLRIPKGGIPLDVLIEALAETRFEAATQVATWVCGETGNFFLDYSFEDEMYNGFADPWEDELIEQGTQEWRSAKVLMDSVDRLVDWLEDDLPARFAEMLDFILGRLDRPDQHTEENDHE